MIGLSAFTANPKAGLTENTPVGSWDAGQNEIASATVLDGTAGPLTADGFFRYATLSTPLTLQVGSYTVGAEYQAGVDEYTFQTYGLSTVSGVTFGHDTFGIYNTLTLPNQSSGYHTSDGGGYFGGNVVIPEPTTCSLLALGIGVLVGARILRGHSS